MAIEDKLYSVEAACEYLGGVSRWSVWAWLSQRRIMRTKVGRRTFIRESELRKLIRDGESSPAPRRGEWK
jgi:excisionase family DNA binding protein